MTYDPSQFTDPDLVEQSGEVESRIFGIYLDAAMPELHRLAKKHSLSGESALLAFLSFRQSNASHECADAINEMTDGFRRSDRDGDEKWRGDGNS